jgi:hypothetical protein
MCCERMAVMADMTPFQRLAMTSGRHSGSCGCCNGEHRATTSPAVPMANNDSPSCAACYDTSRTAA